MKKFILIFFSLLVLAVFGIFTFIYYFLSNLDKNFVVKQIESKLNLRAEISDLKLNIFSLNPEIELIDFKISERDQFANKAIPVSERDPLKYSILSVEKIKVHLNIQTILQKEFKIKEISFFKPKLDLVLFENGGNNLKNLFRKPRLIDGKENPQLSEVEKKKEGSTEPFTAEELPIIIYLDSFKIENSFIQVFIAKNQNKIVLNPANFEIKDFKLNKNDLENENELFLKLDTNLFLKDSIGKDNLELKLISNGKINLFDKSTKLINPFFIYDLTILKTSYLTSLPALDVLSKRLPILNQIGLEIPFLSEKMELENDVNTKISYSSGVITFLKTVFFPLKKFDLAILEKSKLNIITNNHYFRGSSILSKEETTKSLSKVEAYISEKNKIPELNQLKDKLFSSFVENERIKLDFISEGLISSPKLTLENQIPDIKSMLKDIAISKVKDVIINKTNEKLDEGKQKLNDKIKDKLKDKLPIKLPF